MFDSLTVHHLRICAFEVVDFYRTGTIDLLDDVRTFPFRVACFLCLGCVADERAAYSDSSRRSEQLSCTKFFHPSYGLFYINFKRFKSF